jgi:hypothetical protein
MHRLEELRREKKRLQESVEALALQAELQQKNERGATVVRAERNPSPEQQPSPESDEESQPRTPRQAQLAIEPELLSFQTLRVLQNPRQWPAVFAREDVDLAESSTHLDLQLRRRYLTATSDESWMEQVAETAVHTLVALSAFVSEPAICQVAEVWIDMLESILVCRKAGPKAAQLFRTKVSGNDCAPRYMQAWKAVKKGQGKFDRRSDYHREPAKDRDKEKGRGQSHDKRSAFYAPPATYSKMSEEDRAALKKLKEKYKK